MKGKEGFTLVEVMIAMVVLLLGMLGVMGMQYFAISGNTASRELRTGTNLSAEILEEIKGTPYANLASGTNLPATGQAISGAMTGLARAWWVVPNCVALGANGNTCAAIPAPACAANPDAAVVSPVSAIRTRTCWTDTDGTIHSVELDTLRWDENVIP
ncbi:MAG: prepilin-type N-terminal cleavage/methylation domain-containing protein [Nitrospirae bacterium]|nr:prepilin-type N-terminal cleavage/methylation domain-containing protein [Nitrospirota bacterium]